MMRRERHLYSENSGSGPPLLFVHGWLNDLRVWDSMIDRLAQQFRCLAFDLPGHGRSRAPAKGTYGRERILEDIVSLLDGEEIDDAIVVGHSLGGYLGLALALSHPERVAGLALIGAGPGFRNPTSRADWNAAVLATAAKVDLPEGQEAISMHVDSQVIDGLDEIDAPSVVIVGERDKRFLASAKVLEKHLNVVSSVTVADAGHMVHVKAARAAATAIADAFAPGGARRSSG